MDDPDNPSKPQERSLRMQTVSYPQKEVQRTSHHFPTFSKVLFKQQRQRQDVPTLAKEGRVDLQEMPKENEGLCFSYLCGSTTISSVLQQWPRSLVPEVMVSGLDLFQNPYFVFVTFSTALKVFSPRGKGKHRLCRVQCRACGRQCYGPKV